MSEEPLFTVVDNEAVVLNFVTGQILWAGRPLGRDVVELLALPGTSLAVVLVDATRAPPNDRANLLALDTAGVVRWRAELPTDSAEDFFTSIEVLAGTISAFTWSCHQILIDPETGATLRDEYTK